MIGSLTGILELGTASEDIETGGRLRAARDAGSHFGQGFLLCRPLPASKSPARLTFARRL